jgi:hypothetical protein
MKNIFKSRFSLIAICIVLGILIGSFALCGCRTNYGLLEGMAVEEKKKKVTEPLDGDTNLTTVSQDGPPLLNPETIINDATQPVDVLKVADQVSAYGKELEKKDGNNVMLNTLGKALSSIVPFPTMNSANTNTNTDGDTFRVKENFQVSRPLAWGPIKDTESEDVNLTKWVSDAMRYSKGMGNENKLDSYQYNSGPPIPLPEGELFFFKDTKFDPSCCPGTYSNSMGCSCMSKKQFQYLTMRGGNNTIPNTKTSYYNDF